LIFNSCLFFFSEPVTGSIIIDDVDVGRLGLHKLRSRLTIIPQASSIFFQGSGP
jgi:ATP-binding cassette, subfamily C (CFTR/MRP), member 1